MDNKKPKYQTNTDDSVQHIIKIKKSLNRKYVGTNYELIKNALLEVDYDKKALENDEWFIDLLIAKLKSDNNKPTFQFIMPIIYSILVAILGLDVFKNNTFIIIVFLLATLILIALALNSLHTDFQNSVFIEILTIIKKSKETASKYNNIPERSNMLSEIFKISRSIIRDVNQNTKELLESTNAIVVIKNIIGTLLGVSISIVISFFKVLIIGLLGILEFFISIINAMIKCF